MDEIDIRPVAVDERREVIDTIRAALLTGATNDEKFEAGAQSWDESDALAAWDDDRCVGHVAAFRFDMTVPGGEHIPTAGVTRVGVLPSHTRRGLLSTMLPRLLREARDRGQPIATLHASETPIYGRFGFGLGTNTIAATVTTRAAKPWRTSRQPGSMRLLRHTDVLDIVPGLYESVARRRVATVTRPAWMWPRYLKPATEPATSDEKGTFVAVHRDPSGVDDGYVYYEVRWDEDFADNPTGAGVVKDLWGATPAVELALWQYVLDIDIVLVWQAPTRPTDEPVRRAMHDLRAYETQQRLDEQWVRLLDVDAALNARSYGPSSRAMTVEISDPMFADNNGRWSISSAGAERLDDGDGVAPDVAVDIATISAAYLGGLSWFELRDSGAVEFDVPDEAVGALDALFRVGPEPFCGTMY